MADRREGPRAVVDLGHAACRHVRACRLTLIKARTATRFATPGDNALLGRMVRPEMRVAVRLKKPAAGFPGAGSKTSCDDEDMPVICPTAQDKNVSLAPAGCAGVV
jgi:hypothetical protein